jgi:sulfonate transport system ATP-binding protein
MGHSYIEVKGLSKFFKRKKESVHALDNIDFTVNKGELVCILGPSGCGKSTLLRAICGLDADHEGTVLIDGKEILKPEKTRGMVFQEHRLFPWLTVEQNVGFALNDVDKEKKAELIQKHIDLVGLTGFEKAYPRQLSGGMAQRGGIARAIVNDPEVLLLDEPFGALDTFTKMAMQKELKRIKQESNTTMIMVTHDIDEAVFLADKIIVMSSRPGRITKIVDIDLAEPRDRNTFEFLEIRKEIFNEF